MFKIFKKKQTTNFIDSWSKLPVGKFLEINKISKSNEDEDTKSLRCAALLSNKTLKELENLPISDAMEMVSKTAFLYTPIPTTELKKNYNLGDKKYKPLRKMEEMTAAQFIDFQSVAPNINEMLPEFLSIFFVPDGHKYGDREYELGDVINDIKEHLSVVEALALSDFFVVVYRRYVKRILLYSEAEMKMLSWIGPKETRETAKKAEQTLKQVRVLINSMYGSQLSRQ